MPAEASEVVHGVVALGADVVGQELHVDLYGGTPALCASVRYAVPEGRRRRAMNARIQRWRTATLGHHLRSHLKVEVRRRRAPARLRLAI